MPRAVQSGQCGMLQQSHRWPHSNSLGPPFSTPVCGWRGHHSSTHPVPAASHAPRRFRQGLTPLCRPQGTALISRPLHKPSRPLLKSAPPRVPPLPPRAQSVVQAGTDPTNK
ncbi:hypothetical protein NDU88_003502 [Pleurodeles waltl]|uniref:Uncharacterized protein n=1 Tax=Pleurodeles waltl TaxID=8319 RepID=A0AAV7M3J8_PLEWA|nr:hypothetical protein NDU88_003502 [Pleurodeles waltl]